MDTPLQRSGLLSFTLITGYVLWDDDFGHHSTPILGLNILAKTIADLLTLCRLTGLVFVDYQCDIDEIQEDYIYTEDKRLN